VHALASCHTSWSTDRTPLLNVHDRIWRALLWIPLSEDCVRSISVPTQTENLALNDSLENELNASRTTGKILKIVYTVTSTYAQFKSGLPETSDLQPVRC